MTIISRVSLSLLFLIIPFVSLAQNISVKENISELSKNIINNDTIVVEDFEIKNGTVASEKLDVINKMIDERYFAKEQLIELKNKFINPEDNKKIITVGKLSNPHVLQPVKADKNNRQELSTLNGYYIIGFILLLFIFYFKFYQHKSKVPSFRDD